MKTKLVFTLLLLVGLLSSNQAQTVSNPNTIGMNVGFSLAGKIFNSFVDKENVSLNSSPAYQITFDRKINSIISLGGAFSYQKFSIDVKDWSYFDLNKIAAVENFSDEYQRLNFAFRTLFHYGGSQTIDMYSGVRLGFTYWSVSSSSSDPSYDASSHLRFDNSIVFAPQLVLFGLRGYFWNNLGAGGEICIGSPHYLSLGLNYRF